MIALTHNESKLMNKVELIKMLLEDGDVQGAATAVTVSSLGSKVKIVVLQRGWVVVGKYSQTDTEGMLEDAATIRIWGTTKGLGELALDGPTSSTKLDKAGIIRFERLTTVLVLDVKDDDKWTRALS